MDYKKGHNDGYIAGTTHGLTQYIISLNTPSKIIVEGCNLSKCSKYELYINGYYKRNISLIRYQYCGKAFDWN